MELDEIETDQFITIVSGLPRSGTSMMMQMLAAGGIPALADNGRRADEDNPLGYYEFEPVKQVESDASWLNEAEGKAVKMVYRLLYDLPKDRAYRVIFMTRALDEVLASQQVMLERHGKASEGFDNARLAGIYRRQLQSVTSWLHTQPNFSLLSVDHHDVLGDPNQTVQQLNRFLDDCLDTDAMLKVPDWSLYRQRREYRAIAGTISRSAGPGSHPEYGELSASPACDPAVVPHDCKPHSSARRRLQSRGASGSGRN